MTWGRSGRWGRWAHVALLAWAVASGAHAELAPATAVRLLPDERIAVDGRLDDPAWARAVPLDEFWEVDPGNLLPPRVRTEARFLFDGSTLYVGLKAWDPDIKAARAPLSRRDDQGGDEDLLILYLDPTGQRRFAQYFNVNPRGSVSDGLFNEQNNLEDVSPNFRFTARTAFFEGGWTAELAIPFSSLRYADVPLQRWNVLVMRNYPRDDEAYFFATGPMPHEANCTLCYSRPLVGLTELPAGTSFTVTPTVTLRRHGENDSQTPDVRSQGAQFGADVKWRPRPDMFVDATLRPDFSQVEIDAPQLLSNTRYAIYYPEKRPFFLEGGDILQSALPALQTRSIAAPDWGLRLTRRGDDSDYAVILARDSAVGDVLLPTAWYTDTAARRGSSLALLSRGRVHLGSVTLGALYTERRYEGDLGSNRVYGLDLNWNPVPENRAELQWLRSDSTALQQPRGVPGSGEAMLARWSHKGERWAFTSTVTDYGAGFRGDNGFFQEAALRKYEIELERRRRHVGPFNQVGVFSTAQYHVSHAGETQWRSVQAGVNVGLPLSTAAWFAPIDDIQARAGEGLTLRRMRQRHAGVMSVPASWFSNLRIELTHGNQMDVVGDRVGQGYQAKVQARLRPWHRLQFGYQLEDLRIASREATSWNRLLVAERAQQLVTLLHLGPDHLLRLILQSRIVRRDVALYPTGTLTSERDHAGSLTYQVRLASDLSMDAGITRGRLYRSPTPYRSNERELFVKLAYTIDP